jgi:hypothetical protein
LLQNKTILVNPKVENVDFLGLNKTMQVYQKVENGDLVGI